MAAQKKNKNAQVESRRRLSLAGPFYDGQVSMKTIDNLVDPNMTARGMLTLEIEGEDLLMHCNKGFIDDHNKKKEGRSKSETKKPYSMEDYLLASVHWLEKPSKKWADVKKFKYGFPASGFAKGAVRAAKLNGDMNMTDARCLFWVLADPRSIHKCVEIVSPGPIMHESVGRLANGSPDTRHRPLFRQWSATLQVVYYCKHVSARQLHTWFTFAGASIGVGDWRPERGGDFGRYQIVHAQAVEPDFKKMEEEEKKNAKTDAA